MREDSPQEFSDEEYSRLSDRFWDKHTHTRLKHGDLLREEISKQFPKEKLEQENFGAELLSELAANHVSLVKARWKLSTYGSIPVLLLFLSIIGVKWRASALGVELADIQAIKELILLFSTCVGFYSSLNLHRSYLIEQTIETIGTTWLGKEAFEIYKLKLPLHEDTASRLLFVSNDRYAGTFPYQAVVVSWVTNMFLYLLLIIVLQGIPYFYVMSDIWTANRLPYEMGRVLVAACLFATTLNVIFFFAIRFFKYRFLNMSKVAELKRRSEEDIHGLINEVIEDKLTSWDRVVLWIRAKIGETKAP